jgi:hypothetical protein
MREVVEIAVLITLLILYFVSREVVYLLPLSFVIVTILNYHGLIKEHLVWPLVLVLTLIMLVYVVWSGRRR